MGERPGHVAEFPRSPTVSGGDRPPPSHPHLSPAAEQTQRGSYTLHLGDTSNTSDPPNPDMPPNTVETHGPLLPYPPRAIVPVPPHSLYYESDPINQYVASDPRFRDSTLVFPRIRPYSSWPFWNRHRVAILTSLASFVALGFVLVAIIGSITIKEE
ncbi:hypothetical protein FRC08_002321 [Ceratobasidium sp. 394]|nr:hypothetical protein FRC08_002321 [Ceratobasidium sp. 394]